jgi:transposase-like protein
MSALPSALPNCAHCHSFDVRPLITAVTGVAGYRCHDCGRVFFVASLDVAQRIQEAQARRQQHTHDEPDYVG